MDIGADVQNLDMHVKAFVMLLFMYQPWKAKRWTLTGDAVGVHMHQHFSKIYCDVLYNNAVQVN